MLRQWGIFLHKNSVLKAKTGVLFLSFLKENGENSRFVGDSCRKKILAFFEKFSYTHT